MEAINSLMSIQGRFLRPNEFQINLVFPVFMIFALWIGDRALYKDAAIQNANIKKKITLWPPLYELRRKLAPYCKSKRIVFFK